jgi:N-acetylglucosamine-6-phosphate deacetylase
LAGSTLTLERAVANMRAATDWPLDTVWGMASAVPARSLGIADRKGKLGAGMDADLVAVNTDLSVSITVVGGEIVYRR